MLLSASRQSNKDALNIEYYDAQSCICIPSNDAQAVKEFDHWQDEQEQRMVLTSALAAYQMLHGTLPESIEDLIRNYPGNVLSGYTPNMRHWFDKLTNESGEMNQKIDSQEPDSNGPASSDNANHTTIDFLNGNEHLLQQPLEIIVDKENHRLALVSGDMVIRNYPVGLGGDKTPEGGFMISEKVKEPNGSPDGDFGSRGMTLSDTLYAIHGTDEPESIGKDQSLGCIRMLKEDIEELYDMIPKGSKVTILSSGMPAEIIRSENPFTVPSKADETNPNKIYEWLD